jgi:hypothetical protein
MKMVESIQASIAIGTGPIGPTGAKGDKGDKGDEGLSAYEVWINQGNVGTEQDFFNSLMPEINIVDDLVTGGSDKCLSAEQGKVLNSSILSISKEITDARMGEENLSDIISSIDATASKNWADIQNINTSLDNKANVDHTHPLQVNCDTVDGLHLVVISQAEYDGLENKDSSTLYFIKGE